MNPKFLIVASAAAALLQTTAVASIQIVSTTVTSRTFYEVRNGEDVVDLEENLRVSSGFTSLGGSFGPDQRGLDQRLAGDISRKYWDGPPYSGAEFGAGIRAVFSSDASSLVVEADVIAANYILGGVSKPYGWSPGAINVEAEFKIDIVFDVLECSRVYGYRYGGGGSDIGMGSLSSSLTSLGSDENLLPLFIGPFEGVGLVFNAILDIVVSPGTYIFSTEVTAATPQTRLSSESSRRHVYLGQDLTFSPLTASESCPAIPESTSVAVWLVLSLAASLSRRTSRNVVV